MDGPGVAESGICVAANDVESLGEGWLMCGSSGSFPSRIGILTFHSRQCDQHLGSIVGGHYDGSGVGNWEAELVDSNGEVGHHEEDGSEASRQFRPGPEVIGELDSSDGPPAHEADESDVNSHQVGEGTREVGVQKGVAEA